jgi:solute carrier family 25 (mitochondrial iron transporter), member 28/37
VSLWKVLTEFLGPAHAVYFATYEGVKQLMGGNQAGVHHPLAAGMLSGDLCFW